MGNGKQSPNASQVLAQYVVALDFKDLPEQVVAQTRIVVLDTLASVLAASTRDLAASRVIQDFAREAGGAPQASVAGLAQRVPAVHAAFANGLMADNVEMDDSHPRTGAHIAAPVVPTALAVAEWKRKGGRSVIEAIVAAYDVESRAILAANPSAMYARGFHPSAVFGAFGATTAASKVLQLDALQTRNALGLAGSLASGLMAWETDPTQMPKSLQLGLAARNGVTAALLAQSGFSGPPAIFEGRYNVLEAFSDKATMTPLTDQLGSRFEIMLTGLKLYPVCRFLHAALDAFFEIQVREQPQPSGIEQILVKMPSIGVPIIDNNELRSHSAQYVLSLAALRGALQIADLYRDERADPQVASLMKRVRVMGDPALDLDAAGRFSEPAVVQVTMADGRMWTARADAASGDPEKALSWDTVANKFERLATEVVGSRKVAEITHLVQDLDALDDLSILCSLLRK
jgi:2-methylcitrate dehydratase PrpD